MVRILANGDIVDDNEPVATGGRSRQYRPVVSPLGVGSSGSPQGNVRLGGDYRQPPSLRNAGNSVAAAPGWNQQQSWGQSQFTGRGQNASGQQGVDNSTPHPSPLMNANDFLVRNGLSSFTVAGVEVQPVVYVGAGLLLLVFGVRVLLVLCVVGFLFRRNRGVSRRHR